MFGEAFKTIEQGKPQGAPGLAGYWFLVMRPVLILYELAMVVLHTLVSWKFYENFAIRRRAQQNSVLRQ